MKKIIIASTNKGKIKEIEAVFGDLGYEFFDLGGFSDMAEIEEPAMTFEGNAIIKAMTVGEATGILAMADDSGLELDCLHGEPGVKSARWFAGTDKDRLEALLKRIKDVPGDKRGAQFRTVIAVYNPITKKIRTCEGILRGVIGRESKGENGFGYDPVFYIPDAEKTLAEMKTEEKNRISHRGLALEKAKELIRELAK